ncbi:MAG: hypothetical protein EXR66_07510 [Dehalococcoidia bacterium]|nr:hypothetical protein [Dehalococcoidia bacterium]
MTSRLIDVLPVTLGSYMVLLGVVLLLDSTGVRSLGLTGILGAALGLGLVALGVLAILAAWRVRRFSRRLRRTVGHVEAASDLRVQDGVISTVFGDITLDLRDAELPLGETELRLLSWIGTVTVRVPADVGLDVTAQSLLGSVRVLEEREDGLVNDIHVTTKGYQGRPQRLLMRLSTLVGEVTVIAS